MDRDVIVKAMLYDYSKHIDPIPGRMSLWSYAALSIYLQFSTIDRTGGWVPLGHHEFKDFSHLSWLLRTFVFLLSGMAYYARWAAERPLQVPRQYQLWMGQDCLCDRPGLNDRTIDGFGGHGPLPHR